LVQTFVDIVARDCGSVAPAIEAVGRFNAATWALCRRDLALQVHTRNRTNRQPIVGQPATEASGPSRRSADGGCRTTAIVGLQRPGAITRSHERTSACRRSARRRHSSATSADRAIVSIENPIEFQR
jgi:hypothetical protein